MKALTSNRALLSELNNTGDLSRIARDLNRYQSIEKDDEWQCVDGIQMFKNIEQMQNKA